MVTAAMSARYVPIVVRKGRQPEIRHPDTEGLLWETLDGLKDCTIQLIAELDKREIS